MNDSRADTMILLRRMAAGDADAGAELYEKLYQDLHVRARGIVGAQRPDHLLQATALIGEAWLRLAGHEGSWQDRAHFLRTATRAMRFALVDHARARSAAKRAGKVEPLPEAGVVAGQSDTGLQLLSLHEALERLELLDPDVFRVAELHTFGGLTHEECAEVLGVSSRTVDRRWKSARAWLQGELGSDSSGGG